MQISEKNTLVHSNTYQVLCNKVYRVLLQLLLLLLLCAAVLLLLLLLLLLLFLVVHLPPEVVLHKGVS